MTTLKQIITVALTLLIMTVAPAQGYAQEEFVKIEDEPVTVEDVALVFCPLLASMGEQIMMSRQAGVTMSNMVRLTNDFFDNLDDGPLKEMLEDSLPSVIRMAYNEPHYTSEEFQNRAVQRFVVEVDRQCMEGMMASGG